MKLIKITGSHYIVVDDSEIKEGDWYITELPQVIFQYYKSKGLSSSRGKNFKITHSTQPLENGIGKSVNGTYPPEYPRFDKIKQLSLSEVEELIYGYSVEKMAEDGLSESDLKSTDGSYESFHHQAEAFLQGYLKGFKAHQELVKDKLFTVEDMKKAYNTNHYSQEEKDNNWNSFIQSLLPKTEWNVEFDEQGKLRLI